MFHKTVIGLAVLFAGAAYGDTCSEIEAQGTIEVARQLNPAYIIEQPKYWSTSCASLTPTCILFPKSAAEVSTILSTLSANSTEPFAVKSGGHNPNNYFSSVAGGPIISTAKLDQANLNQETGVVDVGPGNRLDGIAAKLQGSGWTFVGGRIGNTGVGGLVLGGGLSYMSAQYGWAASSVLEFEVVLANGTIVKASEDSHSDLFVALKGGGNNFGVVTNYRLQARRQGNVWGGNLAFALRSKELDSKMLAAVRDFTEYNTDDKAAVIVTAERANLNAVDSWILFLFYDGPSPPAGLFKNFTDLKPTLNTCRQRTYADMMAFSNWVVVRGSVVDIATETVPIPSREKKEDVMDVLHAHWRNVTSTVLDVPGVIASIAWQPFPRRIAQQARRLGRDLIDADDDADKFIVEMNYSFIPQSQYERMADTMERTYSGVRERVLAWIADGTLPDAYLPVFMNYGFFRQDYFGRLKASSRALARSVAERYDPEGLFRERTGGWKP